MTKDQLAKKLNGRKIGLEITSDEEVAAKSDRLVVIFGASDDLIELRGAINDEVGACDGGECYIKRGKLIPELDDDVEIETLQKHGVLEYVQKAHKGATKIEAAWCPEGSKFSWEIRTSAPHSAFSIFEDGEPFCSGLVIDLKELP